MPSMKSIITCAIGAVVLALIGVGIWSMTVVSAPTVGQGEAYKQINSGTNRLAQYDHFFALDADIQSQAVNAAAAQAQLDAFNKQYPPSSSAPFSVTEQRSNLLSNATGLVQLCTSNVNQYNNDAASYTKGQFLDAKLPSSENTGACTGASATPPAAQK